MKIATIVLAATAAAVIGSAAVAQQPLTGTITKIDRTTGIIMIQQAQSGTVGASSGASSAGAAEEFKVQDGVSLTDWHVGEKVSFTLTQTPGAKTITKLQKP